MSVADAAPKGKGDGEKRELLRRMRLGDVRKLLRDRYGPIFPDDDAGREDLHELLLLVSLGNNSDVKMLNAIEVWCPWIGKTEAADIIDRINQMPLWQRWRGPEALGHQLRLIHPDRERLKLWRINPCDMGEYGMLWWRKQKDRERKQRLLSGGQSRANYLGNHKTSKEQPWVSMGISRRTYYRRLKSIGTSPSAIKLTSSQDRLVPSEKRQVRKKEVAEKKPTTSIKSVATPKSQKRERQVQNVAVATTDFEQNGHTCANTEQTSNWTTILPPGVSPDPVPSWVLMLSPDMAAMATVAWFYGSCGELDLAA